MKNDVNALREMLFDAIREVRDGTMPPEVAETIRGLAAQVTETAKVEVAYLKVTGGISGTGFIPEDTTLPSGSKQVSKGTGVSITQHLLRG
ncbi:MAG: hypothetical protein PHU46_11980 [Rhodocyclaceae bacterium]|nr:hypothetical protein [Rhodocyclaceae bacterium]